MASALEVEALTARYDAGDVLHGIDLCIKTGTIVALLGANGAGKSTTFRALTGAIATTGVLRIDGEPMRDITPERAARAGIAHVPEGRGTLASLTVAENLAMGAYVRHDRKRTRAAHERVCAYFPGRARRHDQIAGTLSGGEQQMLAIGRALMAEPRIMLLDEPSLGLAPLVVREIFALLETTNRVDHVTIVLAEQNATLALAAAAYAYVLETRRIASRGDGGVTRRRLRAPVVGSASVS